MKECKDHLGNCYKSITAMCRAYNISSSLFNRRISAGKSIEEALTTAVGCKDHKGNIYKSRGEMAKAYGIKEKTLNNRLRLGYSMEEALTKSLYVCRNRYTDHLGNKFSSLKDMCAYHNISIDGYEKGIKLGKSLENILEHINIRDHEGNGFSSIDDMCGHWGITRHTYFNRIKRGLSMQEALTQPIKSRKPGKRCVYEGREYSSLNELYRHYGIHEYAVSYIMCRYKLSRNDAIKYLIENGRCKLGRQE